MTHICPIVSELAPLSSCAGPIPECLGALTDLTRLDLRSNKLTGTLRGHVSWGIFVCFAYVILATCSGPLTNRLLELSGAC